MAVVINVARWRQPGENPMAGIRISGALAGGKMALFLEAVKKMKLGIPGSPSGGFSCTAQPGGAFPGNRPWRQRGSVGDGCKSALSKS